MRQGAQVEPLSVGFAGFRQIDDTLATLSVIASGVSDSPSLPHAFSNAIPIALVVSGSKTFHRRYGVIGIFSTPMVPRGTGVPCVRLRQRLALRRRALPQRSQFGRVSSGGRGRPRPSAVRTASAIPDGVVPVCARA